MVMGQGDFGVGAATSVELKVLVGAALTGAFQEIGPCFERATGHRLDMVFGATPQLVERVVSGAPFDLAVVPVDLFRDPAAKAKFASGPTVDIARVGFGIAIRAGAVRPDISTPEALRKALLAARSVTLVPASAAGAFVLSVFNRLGIGDEMVAKIVPQTVPAKVAAVVAGGEAELAVFLVNVLASPGVELVGPLPDPLQHDLVFTAGIAAGSAAAIAAAHFIQFLSLPDSVQTLKANGLKPA